MHTIQFVFVFFAILATIEMQLSAAAPTPFPTPEPKCGQYGGGTTNSASCLAAPGCWWCLKQQSTGIDGVCQPIGDGRTCANVATTGCANGCLEYGCGSTVYQKCAVTPPSTSPASALSPCSIVVAATAAIGAASAAALLAV